jgi:hypothetical protein
MGTRLGVSLLAIGVGALSGSAALARPALGRAIGAAIVVAGLGLIPLAPDALMIGASVPAMLFEASFAASIVGAMSALG